MGSAAQRSPPALPHKSRSTALEIELSTFDELLNEAGLGAFDPATLAAAGMALVHHGARVRLRRWIWPLLIGASSLAILAAGFAYLVYHRESDSAARFASAEHDFQQQRYAQSVATFEAFLKEYPAHPQAALARVHRAVGRVLNAASGQPEWIEVLPMLRSAIDEVADEPEYQKSRTLVAPALIRMASELVASASAAAGPESEARRKAARERRSAQNQLRRFVWYVRTKSASDFVR